MLRHRTRLEATYLVRAALGRRRGLLGEGHGMVVRGDRRVRVGSGIARPIWTAAVDTRMGVGRVSRHVGCSSTVWARLVAISVLAGAMSRNTRVYGDITVRLDMLVVLLGVLMGGAIFN